MIEEYQRIQRLILSRGGHVAVGCQIFEELPDLRRAHVPGTPPAACLRSAGGVGGGFGLVKMDKALDPIDVASSVRSEQWRRRISRRTCSSSLGFAEGVARPGPEHSSVFGSSSRWS